MKRHDATCAKVKAAYLAGEGSLRELSERFNISLNTLEKRSSKERWRSELTALYGAITESAKETAQAEGRKMGLTASSLVQRSIEETAKWLDRVESVAGDGAMDADKLLKVINAWRGVIDVGREAFGIGPNGPPAVRIDILAQIRPATEADLAQVIDITPNETPV